MRVRVFTGSWPAGKFVGIFKLRYQQISSRYQHGSDRYQSSNTQEQKRTVQNRRWRGALPSGAAERFEAVVIIGVLSGEESAYFTRSSVPAPALSRSGGRFAA